MTRRVAIYVLRILVLVSVTARIYSYGQERHLSPNAQKLSDALATLRQTPDDLSVQITYLKAFPQDFDGFLKLFDLHGELYDGVDFIGAILPLAKNNELEVGRLLVGLSKDAHYDADAPSYLQHATTTYASQHTEAFASLLQSLPKPKQANLVDFLADVENYVTYPQYQQIIEHLTASGHGQLANAFKVAKEKRSHRHHN